MTGRIKSSSYKRLHNRPCDIMGLLLSFYYRHFWWRAKCNLHKENRVTIDIRIAGLCCSGSRASGAAYAGLPGMYNGTRTGALL